MKILFSFFCRDQDQTCWVGLLWVVGDVGPYELVKMAGDVPVKYR